MSIKNFLILITSITLLLWVYFILFEPQLQSTSRLPEVTSYSIICFNQYASINDCKNGYAGGRTNYIVDKENQQVTYHHIDISNAEYMVLKKCTVANENNWNCTYNDGSGTIGFANGIYFSSRIPQENLTVLYVTRTEWENMKSNHY